MIKVMRGHTGAIDNQRVVYRDETTGRVECHVAGLLVLPLDHGARSPTVIRLLRDWVDGGSMLGLREACEVAASMQPARWRPR